MQLHHVNIPVPVGRTKPIVTFYREVLGMEPIRRPEADAGGAWLAIGDGTQLHITERDGANHPKAHFALVVDDLSAVRQRLAEAGAAFEPGPDVFGSGGRGFTRDPAGNRIELIAGPLPASQVRSAEERSAHIGGPWRDERGG